MNAFEQAEVARDNYFQALYEEVRPVVQQWLEKRDTFAANEANVDLISRWITQQGKLASHVWIVSAIQAVGDSLVRKPAPVPLEGQAWRDDIEAKIMSLLVASPAERERERASYHARLALNRDEIQSRRHTGPYLVTDQTMLTRYLSLQEDRRLRSLSHSELVEEVRRKKVNFTYPPLPDNYTPFQISQMNSEMWKRSVALYGVDQLNARLAQQKAAGEWRGMKITGE